MFCSKNKKKYQNFNETNAIQNKNVLSFFAKIPHMLIWSMVCPAGQEFLILNSVLIKHMLTLKEKKIINSKSLKKMTTSWCNICLKTNCKGFENNWMAIINIPTGLHVPFTQCAISCELLACFYNGPERDF